MSIPDHLTGKIRQWLAELVTNTDLPSTPLHNLARQLGALPLYADLGGCIAIRPDGELVLIDSNQDWSKPITSTIEIEPKWRIRALAFGSRRYPDLRALLPTRGTDDFACPDCAGAGEYIESSGGVGLICGACHGLGWRSG